MDQSISENLWWVIPGKLAGVRKPTIDEIVELRKAGVGAIVSVMDDPSNLDLYQAIGINHLWLPIQGGSAPGSEQLQSLQQFVDEQNRLGYGVAVHCTNGRRRTGTLLTAFLIQSGLTFEQAMETLLAANPQVELREAQLEYLKSLAKGIKSV
ncbi:MAG: dual specificity protein phosphatase family protein [Leptolyngbyaceae cyanobacterium bins.302]|nr:dual specificity protein phosphatase family protein [Leptolyngbyaceae cyanobacterium bins.302]